MPSRIKDSNHLLDIIDNIDSMFLRANTILATFDIVNMFPNTENKSRLDAVKSVLLKSPTNTPPVECILEGLKLCLTCNNSILIIGISYKRMVQRKNHICPVHTVIL